MAKKKSKQNQQKLRFAQQRKEYLKRIRLSIIAIVGKDLFPYFTSKDLDLIFRFRIKPIMVKPEAGYSISPKLIRSIQFLVNYYLKEASITIESTQKSLSLYDYYTANLTIGFYVDYLEAYKSNRLEKFKSILDNKEFGFMNCYDIIYDKMEEGLFPYLIRNVNYYWAHYYSFCFESEVDENEHRIVFEVIVKQYPIEKKKFNIDGNVRPAFRIGWTFKDDDFEWIYMLPPQLKLNNLPPDLHIPVYIQSHAIRRLFERIDCIYPSTLVAGVYNALRDCKLTNLNGELIFEYKIHGIKIGYLIGRMKKKVLIIRTFLFLTCIGSPEGNRLHNYIGLNILDAKYLKMDKLSTFMLGKLNEDEELRAIFEKADCLNLVNLFDNLDKFSLVHPDHSPIEMLSSYLKTDNEESFYSNSNTRCDDEMSLSDELIDA